jgi:sugar transferase (PEP-CTERM system associated)
MQKAPIVFNQKNKIILLIIDALVLLISFNLVFKFRFKEFESLQITLSELNLIILVQLVTLYIFGGYDLKFSSDKKQIWIKHFIATFCTILFVVAFNYLFAKEKSGIFGRGILLGSLCVFYFVSCIYRMLIQGQYHSVSKKTQWIVLTTQDYLAKLKQDLNKLNVLSHMFIITEEEFHQIEVKSKMENSGVVVALPKDSFLITVHNKPIIQILMDLRFQGHQIYDITSFYEKLWRKIPVHFLQPEWFAMSEGFSILHHPFRQRLKRLFDISVAVFLIILGLPLFLFSILLVYLESPGPVIFKQIRTGKGGANFKIYKIRTMILNAESDGPQWAKVNDNRILKVGGFLRKARFDELPQLINVIKGDMSFVGPRPERPEFNEKLEKEIPYYQMRHVVQPGLTGWAQVMYSYGASVEDAKEKLQYDLYYIKNHSLILDFLILLKTIRVVFIGGGR